GFQRRLFLQDSRNCPKLTVTASKSHKLLQKRDHLKPSKQRGADLADPTRRMIAPCESIGSRSAMRAREAVGSCVPRESPHLQSANTHSHVECSERSSRQRRLDRDTRDGASSNPHRPASHSIAAGGRSAQ